MAGHLESAGSLVQKSGAKKGSVVSDLGQALSTIGLYASLAVRLVPRGAPDVGDSPEAPGVARHLYELEKCTGRGECLDYCPAPEALVQYAA